MVSGLLCMGHKIHQPHLRTTRDARAVRTRESLRKAMLRLLDLKPIGKITIQEICELAEVGYTTFFRHYPDTESLLNEIAEWEIGELVRLTLGVSDTQGSWAGCLAVCTYVEQHRKLWSTMLTGGAAGVMREEYLRLARQVTAMYAHPGSWPPADLATTLVVSSYIEVLTWWLRDSRPLKVEEVAEILHDAVLQPWTNIQRTATRRAARRSRPR